MISNTYNRYLWLLNTLLQYKRITFQELKNKWENSYFSDGTRFSRRTFHVHRIAVEQMFKVSIECDRSDGYKYYIVSDSTLQRDTARKWLLNSFNVYNMVAEAQDMNDRILLENIPEGSQYLSLIINAMRNNKVLEVEYQPFYEGESAIYHIHPYFMRVHHQRWYVLGFYEERDAIQHFALDRTLGIEITDRAFKLPENFSAEDYYRDHIGIWVNEKDKAENVVIRAYGMEADYLRTLPLHSSQEVIQKTETYTDFKYKLCNTHELVRELLAKGNSVEVLEPIALKEQIIKEAKFLLMRYKRNNQN